MTSKKGVALSFLVCLLCHVLVINFGDSITTVDPDHLFAVELIVSSLLAGTLLYQTPLYATAESSVSRVVRLAFAAHGISLGAYLGIGVLWLLVCLGFGIPPREA